MPCAARRMRKALVDKLACEEREGKRHTKYSVWSSGQLIASTVISHGALDISDGLIGRMAQELCIPRGVLHKIYECPYGWDEYLKFYDANLNPSRLYKAVVK